MNFKTTPMVFFVILVSISCAFAGYGDLTGNLFITGSQETVESGTVLLAGSVFGCETLLIYLSSEPRLLMSLGPETPKIENCLHLYCDLKDFSIQIPLDGSYKSCSIMIEALSKSSHSKAIRQDLGTWYWHVDGNFEWEIEFDGKATGCFGTGICGNSIRIYGPFCDPCIYTLCCYGQVGYIECGNWLCY